jgi:hypothetical protein
MSNNSEVNMISITPAAIAELSLFFKELKKQVKENKKPVISIIWALERSANAGKDLPHIKFGPGIVVGADFIENDRVSGVNYVDEMPILFRIPYQILIDQGTIIDLDINKNRVEKFYLRMD